MDSFGTDEDIRRIVSQYSPMLLRIPVYGRALQRMRRTLCRRHFCAC